MLFGCLHHGRLRVGHLLTGGVISWAHGHASIALVDESAGHTQPLFRTTAPAFRAMAFSVAATAAVAPAGALRSVRLVRRAQPRSLSCGTRRPAVRVRASVREDKAADHGEGVGRYLARAAASLFTPADDHGAPFAVTPYTGTKLTAKDRAHLARFEQVLRKTRDTLEAMPSDSPQHGSAAHAKEHKDIGAPPRRHGRATGATRVRSLACARRPLAGGGGVDGFHKARRGGRAALQGAQPRPLWRANGMLYICRALTRARRARCRGGAATCRSASAWWRASTPSAATSASSRTRRRASSTSAGAGMASRSGAR